MLRHNSQQSQGRSGPPSTTPGWEQQQQQQTHVNSSGVRPIATLPIKSQEVTSTFVLERYSRHNPGGGGSTQSRSNNNLSYNPANQTNNNVAQTKMSTFGGVLASPYPIPPLIPSHTTTTNTYSNNRNNNYSTMSTASNSRSWSVSTTSTPTTGVGVDVEDGRSGGGRSLPETKEHSNWIHLSTPNHYLTLTLKFSFRPLTQADLDYCRPLLLIQTGNEVLDSLGLDRASVRSSKLRGVVKGAMIGFRYTSSSSSSSTSSSSPSSLSPPAPGSNISEAHKFQIKFKAVADCAQCASLLSNWIECQSVTPILQGPGTQGSSSTTATRISTPTTITASSGMGSQTLVQNSQDTDATMAPPPPPSNHINKINNSNLTRFEGTQSRSQNFGNATGAPSLTSAPPATISVSNEELVQILRSATANNAFLPTTTTTAIAVSMSSSSPQEHRQHNRRERLASFTPQFASQPVPVPVSSVLSPSMPTPVPIISTSRSPPSSHSGQSLLQDRGTYDVTVNNNNHNNNNNSSSISTNDEDLASLLNASDAELQENISSILIDPAFPDLLLKVDRLLRGPSSKRKVAL